jgi:hypothetical protein
MTLQMPPELLPASIGLGVWSPSEYILAFITQTSAGKPGSVSGKHHPKEKQFNPVNPAIL